MKLTVVCNHPDPEASETTEEEYAHQDKQLSEWALFHNLIVGPTYSFAMGPNVAMDVTDPSTEAVWAAFSNGWAVIPAESALQNYEGSPNL